MNRRMVVSVLAFSAVAFTALLVLSGEPAFCAETGDIVIHSGRVDINHGIGAEPIDQLDIAITFTNTEASDGGVCEAIDNPARFGLVVTVQEGACGSQTPPVNVTIPNFNPKSPRSTFAKFQGITKENANVDALLRVMPTPTGTCGRYHLTLDALPLDMSSITANPVALSMTLPDGSTGCVTVNNATF